MPKNCNAEVNHPSEKQLKFGANIEFQTITG